VLVAGLPDGLNKEHTQDNYAQYYDNKSEYPHGYKLYLISIVKENIEHCKGEDNLGQRDHVAHNRQDSFHRRIFYRPVARAQQDHPDDDKS
jgi:hypothetical protein